MCLSHTHSPSTVPGSSGSCSSSPSTYCVCGQALPGWRRLNSSPRSCEHSTAQHRTRHRQCQRCWLTDLLMGFLSLLVKRRQMECSSCVSGWQNNL